VDFFPKAVDVARESVGDMLEVFSVGVEVSDAEDNRFLCLGAEVFDVQLENHFDNIIIGSGKSPNFGGP
jgi:hypothetical protein